MLKDEAAAREYMRQLWAEVMEIYKSGNYSLRLPKEMERQMAAYRADFMAEDTATGMIQAWLDDYKGDFVCTKLIYTEAYHMEGEPDRKVIGEINDIMNNTVQGWEDGPQHRFQGYGQQRSWVRSSVNSPTKSNDGFLPVGDNPDLMNFLSD